MAIDFLSQIMAFYTKDKLIKGPTLKMCLKMDFKFQIIVAEFNYDIDMT